MLCTASKMVLIGTFEMPCAIQQTIACGGQEPCLRIVGDSVTRPCVQCREQCVSERIFGTRRIMGPRRQQRDETPV